MRYVCYFLILLGVTNALAPDPPRNLAICKPWACIQEHFGLNATWILSDRAQLEAVIAQRLPEEEWKVPTQRALDVCLSQKKPRRYSKTCPGQETWHCLVDQLSDNCPESKLKKEDACSPVSSLLGAKYLFSQNTYVDIERNLKNDRRPPWFMRNYLSAKCCDMPALFTASSLQSCNVSTFLNVYRHQVASRAQAPARTQTSQATTESYCSLPLDDINPLECCDISDIMPDHAFGECGVKPKWSKEKNMFLKELDAIMSTTEAATTIKPTVKKYRRHSDIKVVPLSCAQESCVFSKLGVITPSGSLDRAAFTALLDNVTREHAEWTAARARVVARCLHRDLSREYDARCEINSLLACALDVLSENCPNAKKGSADPCRHTSLSQNSTTMCQVSSSKYRRSRHRYCDVPRLVPPGVLSECGLTSISRLVAAEIPAQAEFQKKTVFKYKPSCINTSNATACALSKLDLLNKYGFLDNLKLKGRVETATRRAAWAARAQRLRDAIGSTPLYRDYCVTTRKILNLMHSAVTSCPFEKRKYTNKCANFFGYLTKCTNASSVWKPISPANKPTPNKLTPVKLQNPKKTLLVQIVHPPLIIKNVAGTQYAPSYAKFVPIPFQRSQYLPASANSKLGFGPLYPANSGQPFPGSYSPIYSHRYIPAVNSDQLRMSAANARLLPYSPYYNDGFRSASDPFLLHNKIAGSQQKLQWLGYQKGADPKTPSANKLVQPPPAPLEYFMPVEGQVFE